MKWFIKFSFLLNLCIPTANIYANTFNAVTIYYHRGLHQQALWANHILVKNGIPEDFINLSIDSNNCQMPKRNNALLILCIDQKKVLNVIKFDRENFFWQMKPLLGQE